ncbi:hypothetical protein MJM59_33245, partial [Salmonella enterica subsp. enterica serovar Montevideo]|nr:hypothetical protein [Salmonella enterica subsp. enterica serovar Montevideo]
MSEQFLYFLQQMFNGVTLGSTYALIAIGYTMVYVFVECALDTGADLRWLVNGELANAKLDVGQVNLKGKQLYDE